LRAAPHAERARSEANLSETKRHWLFRLLRAVLVLALAGVAGIAMLAVVLWIGLQPPKPLAPPQPGAYFARVTLVEPGVGRSPERSLRVEGDRIAAIADATGTDAYADAYVLPGFTDMHVHLPAFGIPGDRELWSFLLLAHGVTTARIAGEFSADASRELRADIAAGRLPGPRFSTCGAFVDGDPPLWPGSSIVRNPDEARAAVAELAESGVDCIKAYDGLDLESTRALREAAHARDLPLIGHTPVRVAFEDARLDDVQHLRGAHPPLRGEKTRYPFFLAAWRRSDAAWLDSLLRSSLAHGIAHTPTLVTIDGLLGSRDPKRKLAEPALALIAPVYREALWHPVFGLNASRFLTGPEFLMVEEAFARMREAVGHLHRGGVSIHTGTDAGAPMVVPGASLHRELRLLADSGLGIEAALEASTRMSPAFLGVADAGALRVGAPADLLVFREDPSRDLAALDTLLAVVQAGRLYDRTALDAQLAAQRTHHESWLHAEGLPRVSAGFLDALLARLATPES
jgi:imidazolonepropionase-like amidohydrolase